MEIKTSCKVEKLLGRKDVRWEIKERQPGTEAGESPRIEHNSILRAWGNEIEFIVVPKCKYTK